MTAVLTGFPWFFSSPPGSCYDSILNQAMFASFHIIFNPLFFSHPINPRYIIRAIRSIVKLAVYETNEICCQDDFSKRPTSRIYEVMIVEYYLILRKSIISFLTRIYVQFHFIYAESNVSLHLMGHCICS